VPLSPKSSDPLAKLYEDFRAMHDRVYGHAAEAPARIVNLRSIHRSAASERKPVPYAPDGAVAKKGERRILTADGPVTAAVYRRTSLTPGAKFAGPAIVEQADTTTLIEPGWQGTVAENGALILTAARSRN